MPRRSKKGPDTFLELPDEQSSEVIIVKHGDTVLDVKDQETGIEQHYRCSRAVLRNSSEYFAVLFDPEKFSEGKAIEAKLQELYTQYDGPIPSSKLPRVTISDVGELPKAGASTKTVVTLFLKILHEPTTPWPVKRSQSINRVALLAIVADRFGAHALIAVYLRRHELDVTLLKDRKMSGPYKHELANRQRLLAGMVFGFPQWVLQCSAALIIDGPSDRTHQKLHSSDEDSKNDNDALWWRLPGGLEDEIFCRREYVLETLSSIQKHFIALYASRQPQCRLGYGSSPNCDSFQLGESVRFFSRKGLLRVESAYTATSEEVPEPYTGSIEDIMARLRECTSYQIDIYHQHCGLRTRLMPILDSLWPLNQVWICLDCWRTDTCKESWLENPNAGKWYWAKKKTWSTGGCQAHRDAKAMYTASRREWTPN